MHKEIVIKRGIYVLLLLFVMVIALLSAVVAAQGGLTFKGTVPLLAAIFMAVTAVIILVIHMRSSGVNAVLADESKIQKQTVIPETSQQQQPALMLLTLLQEKGRFLDFLMEDIDRYPDTKVCAAARVVHQGCKEVIRTVFDPQPVSELPEKGPITLAEGFPSEAFTITGAVGQQPPFTGTLLHRGWRAQKIKLPSITRDSPRADSTVIVPAQVKV
jgi:hypothetical protein